VNIGGISLKTVAIYGAINFGAINLLLQKMEQFYGAIIWYHVMAPFYGMCVPGFTCGFGSHHHLFAQRKSY